MLRVHNHALSFDATPQGTWIADDHGDRYWRYMCYNSSQAAGDRVEYKVTLEAGTYDLEITHVKGVSGGDCRVYLGATLLDTIDMHNSSTINSHVATIAGITVPSSGEHTLAFETVLAKRAYPCSISFYQLTSVPVSKNVGFFLIPPGQPEWTNDIGTFEIQTLSSRPFSKNYSNAVSRADGDKASYDITLEPGTYTMKVFFPRWATIGGKCEWRFDATLLGTVNHKGTAGNNYSVVYAGIVATGDHTISMTCNGSDSADYLIMHCGIALWRTA